MNIIRHHIGKILWACMMLTTALPAAAGEKCPPDSLDVKGIPLDNDSLVRFNDIIDMDSVADESVTLSELLSKGKKKKSKRNWSTWRPEPKRALWMAAVIPGGGQIYNRKYWKLPIIYGGFLGLVYGYNWNQRYYKTYQNAYRDLMNGSANASYLQFLPGRTEEQKKQYAKNHYSYLQTTFQRKRNTYRNWRDYCVVGMLGVYLVSIVDAYVDAALYHFDVSPELDAMNNPAMVVSYKIDF